MHKQYLQTATRGAVDSSRARIAHMVLIIHSNIVRYKPIYKIYTSIHTVYYIYNIHWERNEHINQYITVLQFKQTPWAEVTLAKVATFLTHNDRTDEAGKTCGYNSRLIHAQTTQSSDEQLCNYTSKHRCNDGAM